MKFMQQKISEISHTKKNKYLRNIPCNRMYTNKRQIIGRKPPSISNYQPDLESIEDKVIRGSSIVRYLYVPRYIY